MVQYLQNNVIMKWTTRFIRFTGWIPLKYGSTTTPPIIAHYKKNSDVKPRISHCDSQNLQYKTHPEFWPSRRRIFKTSLYYKTRLILETFGALIWEIWRYYIICLIRITSTLDIFPQQPLLWNHNKYMCTHVSTYFCLSLGVPVISTNIRTVGFCVKTALILQWKNAYVSQIAHT